MASGQHVILPPCRMSAYTYLMTLRQRASIPICRSIVVATVHQKNERLCIQEYLTSFSALASGRQVTPVSGHQGIEYKCLRLVAVQKKITAEDPKTVGRTCPTTVLQRNINSSSFCNQLGKTPLSIYNESSGDKHVNLSGSAWFSTCWNLRGRPGAAVQPKTASSIRHHSS